jgi:hypothetical protein
MKTLDFTENKVQVLGLDDLEQSYHENHVDGTPVNGIYHYVLIHQLLEIFQSHGLQPDVQEIFAANNRDSQRPGVTVLPEVEERDGKGALSAHLMRRVYANIALRCDESDEVVTNVAVAYHQRGIQLAIGPMVKVCHNQCIMGRPDVAANYSCFGGDKLDKQQRTVDHLIDQAAAWAMAYEEQQKERNTFFQQMRETQITWPEVIAEIFGHLLTHRVKHDSKLDNIHCSSPYALNSAQLNEACEAVWYKDWEFQSYGRTLTFWDVYQCMNNILKPDSMDIPAVLPQSLALIETLQYMLRSEIELYKNKRISKLIIED